MAASQTAESSAMEVEAGICGMLENALNADVAELVYAHV